MKETLSEMAQNTIGKDVLDVAEEGHFKGVTYVYKEDPSGLLVATAVHFDVYPDKALDPFRYIRPIENPNSPFDPPEEIDFNQDPRVGYYPLVIVNNVRRPHHLYEADRGLVTAVKGIEGKGDSWFIRYFPNKNIDTTVMDQARQILSPQIQIPLPKASS